MRVLRRFTAFDVQATAEVGRDNLKKYIKALHKAGYLREIKPKANGEAMGHAVWLLVRDSGPNRPLARFDKSGMYDPNTDKVWVDGKEVCDGHRDESQDGRP